MLQGSGCGYRLKCLCDICSAISEGPHGSANHSDNGENKNDEVTFQLAAVDLNSVHLWSKIIVTDIVF